MPVGQMRDPHGGVRLVHVLAAGSARPVGVDAEVALVDLDVLVLGQERGDDDLGEGGVAPVGRVERRLADEPVDAPLGLVGAVGVLALHGHRRRLEARLLARARLDELRLVAAVGRPAQVHPQHHLGPVLGIGAAGAGVDRDDGVARVVLAVEERVLLQPRELCGDGRELGAQLVLERRVELEQLARPPRPRRSAARSGRAAASPGRARWRCGPPAAGRPRTRARPWRPRAPPGGPSA